MTRKYVELEKKIRNIFLLLHKQDKQFKFNGAFYRILNIGKPTVSRGEPVTDIYAKCINILSKKNYEFKISIKKNNADFVVNKISSDIAERLFGDQWKKFITKSLEQIEKHFKEKPFIYKAKSGRTEKGSITLGWKYEVLFGNRGGDLSGKLDLDNNKISDILKGKHISREKKDAKVNGETIKNSGLANYILKGDIHDFKSINDIIDKLELIDENYVKHNKISLCFACKALNYRSLHIPPKWDGDRPLASYIQWYTKNQILHARIILDDPLNKRGNEIGENLKNSLNSLGVINTDDLNATLISKDIKVFDEI